MIESAEQQRNSTVTKVTGYRALMIDGIIVTVQTEITRGDATPTAIPQLGWQSPGQFARQGFAKERE